MPGTQQPYQMASRDVGVGFPGVNFLQQLLGREGRPNLPDVQQISKEELIRGMEDASKKGDTQRFHFIRQLLETGQPPLTTAEPVKKQGASYNPFGIIDREVFGGK